MMSRLLAWILVGLLVGTSCRQPLPKKWGEIDWLQDAPPVSFEFAGEPVESEDYYQFLRWGESFFRAGGYGTEVAITDVLGVLQGTVQAPCGPGCTEDLEVFDALIAAVDRLDGVEGNLFEGNGEGYTSNLVLRFPPGTTLHGLPVPEKVSTGLDVDAGAPFPIGVVPVATTDDYPWLIRPEELGMPGAPGGAFRVRLSCAACHYSLDIDQDGVADLHSTLPDHPTDGSPYKPHHGWVVGNQDLDFGWLVSLSANPLLAAFVLGGDVHNNKPNSAGDYARWVRDHLDDPDTLLPTVIRSILLQPRGYADVSSDARYNTIQIPALYTQNNWPANCNGELVLDTDRNNTVWTGALDFTGLIGLCRERGTQLPWEAPDAHYQLRCDQLVEMYTRYSPAASDPVYLKALRENILGTSDGVPGLQRADSVVVMKTTGSMPKTLYESSFNDDRRARVEEYPYGKMRGNSLALLGYRLAVPPKFAEEHRTHEVATRLGTNPDEVVNNSLSVFLDWLEPPPNTSPMLTKELVRAGQEVFVESGCKSCHDGPFLTDNIIHWLGDNPVLQYGLPRAPSTAGWRVLHRGRGPAMNTEPRRTVASRTIRRFVGVQYDPATGLPTAGSGALPGLLRVQEIGYKTAVLRGLWASAPYLHDGGVAVSVPAKTANPTDLASHLSQSPDGLLFGADKIVTHNRTHSSDPIRADAALSLQALLLSGERQRVISANERPSLPIAGTREKRSMAFVGVHGVGHEFYINDAPGGPKITALVAFLLALDDCPADSVGGACVAERAWEEGQ